MGNKEKKHISEKTEKPIVYTFSKGFRIMFLIATPPMIALAIWILLESIIEEHSRSETILLMLISIGMISLFISVWVIIFKWRLEIFKDRIIETSVFKTKELFFTDIKGYKAFKMRAYGDRIVKTKQITHIHLVANIPKKPISVSLYINNKDRFIRWVTKNFPDLDK